MILSLILRIIVNKYPIVLLLNFLLYCKELQQRIIGNSYA